VRRLKLGPLPLQAAAEYATKLLVPYARGRARPAQDRAGYAALMAWLDGHPLSMKLILPHLEDRPARDLLAGLQGQGPLPPGFDGEGRTEGLGASMRYSLDHIAPETRALLPVLSLFEGVADADVLRIMSDQPDCPALYAGVSREVWGAALDRAARLGLLTALGGGVYRLHPALPAYLAAEWRATAGESYAAQRESTRDALVAAHADFGQWLHGQMTGASAPRAFGLVDLQRRTLSRMIEAALAAGRHEPAQDMLQPLFAYLKARGLTAELRSWIDRALDATEQADGTAPEFDSAAGALWLFVKSNDANLALAAHDLDAAAAIYRDIRNALQAALQTPARDRRLATTHHQLGRVAQDRGDLDAAEEQYRKALAICEALSERPGMAGTYHQLGIVAQLRGDLAAAEHWLRKSLAIKEALGNQPGMASSYGQLGLVALYRGDLDTAEDQHREALEIFNALGDRPSMASTYHHLGMVAQERGDLDAAENQYRKALAIFDALGNQPGMASTFHHLGIVAQERGHFGVAENWIRKSLAIKDALGDQLGMASSYHQLGIVVQLGGDLFAAEDWLRKALAIFDALGDRPNMAGTYHQLGIVVQLRGDLDAAEDWLRKSLAIKEALGDRPGMALSYGQVSLLAEARGDTEAALVSMIRCVTLFDTFGHPATGPAPRHLARLACALGPDALATAWQEVTGDPPPEGLWQALEQIDKDTDDDTP